MRTPDELRAKLNEYPDLDTATVVYHEANHLASQYKKIARDASDEAFNRMPTGTMKVKTASGHSCGYTQPKAARLNTAKWQAYLEDNPDIASQIKEAEQFIDELQAQFMTIGDARFYIR